MSCSNAATLLSQASWLQLHDVSVKHTDINITKLVYVTKIKHKILKLIYFKKIT